MHTNMLDNFFKTDEYLNSILGDLRDLEEVLITKAELQILKNEIIQSLPADVTIQEISSLSHTEVKLFTKDDIIYQQLSLLILSKNRFDQFLVVAIPDKKRVAKLNNRYLFINQPNRWYFYDQNRASNRSGENYAIIQSPIINNVDTNPDCIVSNIIATKKVQCETEL
jgi:hypothetical protein